VAEKECKNSDHVRDELNKWQIYVYNAKIGQVFKMAVVKTRLFLFI
jgi:hypothetical protein